VVDFVVGSIDMVTMEKKNTFLTHQVRTYTCNKVYKVRFGALILGKHSILFISYYLTCFSSTCTSC